MITMMVNGANSRRVIELYGEETRDSEKRLLQPQVCKPPITSDEYFQKEWTCNRKMEGPFGYPRNTVCLSQCKTGAAPLRGTSMKIKCVDLKSIHDGISKEWNPKPLFCKPEVCDTKYIKNKGITENGKWEPESCIMQQKVLVGTVCRFICNKNSQWFAYGFKPEATCSRGGSWKSYNDRTGGWSKAKCIIRPSQNTPVPGAPWTPRRNYETIDPSYLSRHKERQKQLAKEERMRKILAGEIEGVSNQEQNEALAWRHNKTKEKEQQEFKNKVRKLISDSGHDPDETLAKAEKFKEEGESYVIKGGEVFKLTNPPPRPKPVVKHKGNAVEDEPKHKLEANHKVNIFGDTNRVNEGIVEVIDGVKEVVEGSSNIVLIIVLSCLGVTLVVIIVLGIYFKTRKKTAYAIVDERGEQLLPTDYNTNNNSKIRQNHESKSRISSHNCNNHCRQQIQCSSNSDDEDGNERHIPLRHINEPKRSHRRHPSKYSRYEPITDTKCRRKSGRCHCIRRHKPKHYKRRDPSNKRYRDDFSVSTQSPTSWSEEEYMSDVSVTDNERERRSTKTRPIKFVIK